MRQDQPAFDLEQVLALCVAGGRVCPEPMLWNRLWKLLPDRKRVRGGWAPPLPLVLSAWWGTTDAQKRARLREHILWAYDHGELAAVGSFLLGLEQADWHLGHGEDYTPYSKSSWEEPSE